MDRDVREGLSFVRLTYNASETQVCAYIHAKNRPQFHIRGEYLLSSRDTPFCAHTLFSTQRSSLRLLQQRTKGNGAIVPTYDTSFLFFLIELFELNATPEVWKTSSSSSSLTFRKLLASSARMLSPASDTPLKAKSKASLVEGLAPTAPEPDVGGLDELAEGGARCSVAQSCSITASTVLPSLSEIYHSTHSFVSNWSTRGIRYTTSSAASVAGHALVKKTKHRSKTPNLPSASSTREAVLAQPPTPSQRVRRIENELPWSPQDLLREKVRGCEREERTQQGLCEMKPTNR